MAVSCAKKKKRNLGVNRCKTMPALPKTMYITPANFEITDLQILDPEFWQAALLANPQIRVYPFPLFKLFENVSEEAIYEDTPLSYEPVRDGQYRFKFSISDGICTHTAMFTHRGSGERVLVQDINNNVWVTEKANGNYAGLSIAMLNTEKFVISDGSVTTKSPVLVALSDNTELDQSGYIFNGAFLLQLERLTDVELNVIQASIATDSLQLTVNNVCDGTEVLGLLSTDWVYLDDTGTPVVVTSSYANGVYTIEGDLVDGTLTLRAPALLTVKAYEAIEPAIIEVS